MDQENNNKKRNPRLKNADESENRLFVDILKNASGGKLWKIITQGTSKRQESHDVWVTAASIFSRESGTEMTWKQAKSKWFRMKEISKKKADKAHADREFKKLCQRTGGGPAPIQPPLEDADEDNDLDLGLLADVEPMETTFNMLVRAQDRMTSRAGGSVAPSSSCATSSQTTQHSTPQSQTTGTYPHVPHASHQHSTPQSQITGTHPHASHPLPTPSHHAPQIYRRFSPGSVPPSSSMAGITARGSLTGRECGSENTIINKIRTRQNPAEGGKENESVEDDEIEDLDLPDLDDGEQILIIDGEGQRRVVEKSVPETPKTAPKKSKKKTVNEEGANYFSRMLDIQEDLYKERVKVFSLKKCWLKKKIENEQLLKIWLKKKIVNEDGNGEHEIPHKEDLGEANDSDTSDEDVNDEDFNNV